MRETFPLTHTLDTCACMYVHMPIGHGKTRFLPFQMAGLLVVLPFSPTDFFVACLVHCSRLRLSPSAKLLNFFPIFFPFPVQHIHPFLPPLEFYIEQDKFFSTL